MTGRQHAADAAESEAARETHELLKNRRDRYLTVPKGWQTLIDNIETQLQQHWPNCTIERIDLGHGTLHLDADPGIATPDFPDTEDGHHRRNLWDRENIEPFYRLLHDHETTSTKTCEQCGQRGKLGTQQGTWRTLCPGCAPDNWHPIDMPCAHTVIDHGTCTNCGFGQLGRLEHSNAVLYRVHSPDTCAGRNCPIHNRSDHPLRSYPQHWSAERGIMERACPHGTGHPDPDDMRVRSAHQSDQPVHVCDGCCDGNPAEHNPQSPKPPPARPRTIDHRAGCLKASGNCCPWPGDCACPCTCSQPGAAPSQTIKSS